MRSSASAWEPRFFRPVYMDEDTDGLFLAQERALPGRNLRTVSGMGDWDEEGEMEERGGIRRDLDDDWRWRDRQRDS